MNKFLIIFLILLLFIVIFIQSIYKLNIEHFYNNQLSIDELKKIIDEQYKVDDIKYNLKDNPLDVLYRSGNVLLNNGLDSLNYVRDILKNGYNPYDNKQLGILNNIYDQSNKLYIQNDDLQNRFKGNLI